MSDEGFGVPPEQPKGTPEPAWEPVNSVPPPQYGAGQGYPPPPPPGYVPPAGGQYPPPPPAGGYAPPGYPPPPPGYVPSGYVPPPGAQAAPGLTSNGAAALSYVTFIPAIVFLVMEPYNRDPFVKFNAWQCILLTGVWIVVSLLFLPLAFVHLLGMGILLHLLGRLALFVLWLVAIINAARGTKFKIPVIGDMAESLASK